MAAIFGFLLVAGRRFQVGSHRGWALIVAGFRLLLFGSILDITDNFESLNRFVVIGDTEVEAFLEKLVGYQLGFVLLFIGHWLWLPHVGGRKEEAASSDRRVDLPTAMVLLLGAGISAAAYFWSVRSYEHEHIQHHFEAQVGSVAVAMGKTVDRYLGTVQSISGLYAASQKVDRGEFQAFVQRPLSRHPGIQVLGWAPRIPAGERAAYERQAQFDGHAGFRITERNDSGDLVPAAPREEYYPVYFVEPFHSNVRTLGFDLASNTMYRKALERARDTGEIAATGRVTPLSGSESQYGFLAFVPIYSTGRVPATIEGRREHLTGFAHGFFHIGNSVDTMLGRLDGASELDIYLIDESAEPGERLLYYRLAQHPSGSSEPLSEDQLFEGLVHTTGHNVAGWSWTIVLRHDSVHVSGHTSPIPWAIAAVGLLLTILLAQYIASSRDRARKIQRLVDMRSKELTAANENLKREIAEREQIEEARRDSEQRLAGILDNAREAIISVDLHQRIRLFNQGAEGLFGYSAEEVLGEPLEKLLPARFREIHFKHVADFAGSSDVSRTMDRRGTLTGRKKDGTEFSLESSVSKMESGGETIFTAMLHDVTERLRMEDALREGEKRFRAVVQNSPAAIFMKDLEGRFVLVNERFREWYCTPEMDPLGKTSYDIVPKELAERFLAQDRQVLDALEVTEREEEIPLRDGKIHSILITKFPIFDAEGQPVGVGTISTDLTNQRQAENQLRQAQKMDAIGQLTGGIAHDFNNLLMVIGGYAQRAQKSADDKQELDTNLQEVLTATEKATGLTRQLLSFSRRQVMESRVFRVSETISELEGLLKGSLSELFELKIEIGDEKVCAETDDGEFSQAIVNLVINARDAMPRGGRITVGLETVELDDDFVANDPELIPGRYAAITVEDQGVGIDPALLARIFEPFFTTKEQGKGTGLGLAMVYGFAQQSGGTVKILSTPGEGTKVCIYLPAAESEPLEVPSEVKEVLLGKGETILVVEDDESLLRLASSTLEDLGYKVLRASSGLEALEVDEEHEVTIDLLLTDVVMPALGGFELAEMMHETRPNMKIVFMSGYPNRDRKERVKIAEDSQFLQKPVKTEHLAKVIRAELDSESIRLAG
jgi:PAS domain S-box-containing protein